MIQYPGAGFFAHAATFARVNRQAVQSLREGRRRFRLYQKACFAFEDHFLDSTYSRGNYRQPLQSCLRRSQSECFPSGRKHRDIGGIPVDGSDVASLPDQMDQVLNAQPARKAFQCMPLLTFAHDDQMHFGRAWRQAS